MGFANQQKLMKQMQKMQADMARLQDALGDMTVEASGGGGAIRCVMTCKMELTELKIDPELLDPQELDMLEDLLIVTVNDACRKAQEKANDEMSRITGNIKIPGLY